ncbi:MAG: phosphoribosylglycinamide formyltransferase [Alphaproteobacteria bacterium]|nr:phosphoribosylglycinamide formyltransferase [Alphaproteobacteria bacterium]TAD87641.1 MAG: phosphoribosylglycinamide formyltransferase [Alphaproteobacteria bacterium]
MRRVGVLISGRGSNLQALIDAAATPDYPAQLVVVIANRADAGGLERASKAGIPTVVVPHRAFPTREAFDAALDAELRRHSCDLVCLAGFMRLLTPGFVEGWHNRLINIHPSLLPAFKGTDGPGDALAAGVRIAGCTVHLVRAEMDSGPILVQAAVPVLPGDDRTRLAQRILAAEHQAYPLALRLLASGAVRVEGDQLVFANPDDQARTALLLQLPLPSQG